MRRAVLLLAVFSVACDPPEPLPGQYVAPIVGGTRELGEDAVVTITAFGGGGGLCTGTLISPNVVLTAKHCVQSSGSDTPYPVTAFTVGVGDAVGDTFNYRVRYVETTPGVYTSSMTTGLRGEIFGIDVAVLVLRAPAEGVTPIPIRRDRPDDMIGQEFTAIGFGQRPDGGAGFKYKGTGTVIGLNITAPDEGILFSEMIICSGDSGGPAIQEGPERRVIGVASFGEAGSCPSSRDGYNTVFTHLDMIDRATVIAGDCLGFDETCNSIDDDCDGTIDEGCTPLGESCTASTECANAQLPGFLEPLASPVECVDLGDGSICTRPCDPTRSQTACGSLEGYDGADVAIDGFYCRRNGCDGFCAPGGPGAAIDGTACTADTECSSLLCSDPGDGNRRCLPPCSVGLGECPVSEVCVSAGGECGACVDGSIVSGGRSFGEPCTADSECSAEGSCAEGYCTQPCDATTLCPDGFRCSEMLCRRGGLGGLGDPCEDNPDCGPMLFCADQGGRGWCTAFCERDDDCAAGMRCTETGGGLICSPIGGLLGEACSGGECVEGTCEGELCTRACGAGAPCPLGFECSRDAAGNARCLAVEGEGGCSVSPGGSPAPAWMVLALGLVFFGRRRR